MATSTKILIDSCVILSRIPRAIVYDLAQSGAIEIVYAPSILNEVRHVASRKAIEADIEAAIIDLKLLAGDPVEAADPDQYATLWLPDEGDRHVVLAAIGGDVDIILTENLRDFPRAALEPLGLRALSPDQLYVRADLVDAALARGYEPSELKRAKLYRLAKLAKNKLRDE